MANTKLDENTPILRQRKEVLGLSIPAPLTFRCPDEDSDTTFRAPTSKYTPQIARKICEQIMQGKTLNQICKHHNMPSKERVVHWLAQPKNEDFREMYYYARRVQAEILVDEIIEIADDNENDWTPSFNKKGEQNGWKPDHECIQRSRVRIDTRKWLAAKMLPRMYGEKVDVTHSVTGDLAKIMDAASNNDTGLPPAIDGGKNES
jgi:hypothetical protein